MLPLVLMKLLNVLGETSIMTRVYNADSVPSCQWDGCKFDAISQVYNENCTESIFVCRAHRGVVEINLEMSGKLRVSQAQNPLATERPGTRKVKGPRPGENTKDWEKVAAEQANAAATPIDPIIDENAANQGQRAIISDVPTPRKSP